MNLQWLAILSWMFVSACDVTSTIADETSKVGVSSPFRDTTVNQVDEVEEDKVDPSACLSSCQTEPIANIAFQVAKYLAPPSCKVKDFRIFAFSQHYLLLTWADCLEGYQVYGSKLTLDGDMLSEPRPVSQLCYKNFQEVLGFAAASDGKQVLLSYACRVRAGSSISSKAFVGRLEGQDGGYVGGSEYFSENYAYTTDWKMNAAYNVEARAYGVFLRGGFYRFDSLGKQLGGVINTYQSNSDSRLETFGGHWFVISQSSYGSSSLCSKLNAYGVLECDRKPLDRKNILMTSSRKTVSSSYSYNGSDEPNIKFEVASFNPDTCSMSVPKPIGTDQINSSDRLLFAEAISGDVLGVLYEDTLTNSLKLTVMKNQLSGKVLSVVSVSPAVALVRSSFFMRDNEIQVYYLDSIGLRMSQAPVLLGN